MIFEDCSVSWSMRAVLIVMVLISPSKKYTLFNYLHICTKRKCFDLKYKTLLSLQMSTSLLYDILCTFSSVLWVTGPNRATSLFFGMRLSR